METKKIKILFFLLLLCTAVFAQDRSAYFNAGLDPNMLTGWIDNPRTDHATGLDINLETGLTGGNWKIYIYYGQFAEIGYREYGAGADYIFRLFKNLHLSAGFAYGWLDRVAEYYTEETVWRSSLAANARAKLIFWISERFGATAKLQFQQRTDLPDLFGIVEGGVGVVYKINL